MNPPGDDIEKIKANISLIKSKLKTELGCNVKTIGANINDPNMSENVQKTINALLEKYNDEAKMLYKIINVQQDIFFS